MRMVNYLAMSVLAVLAMSAPAILAEPVPDRASGVWSRGNCGDDGLTFLVNSNSAILIITSESREATMAVGTAEWADGAIVLTLDDKDDEWNLPLEDLQRCESLPGITPILFAESFTIFGRRDELVAACGGESGITARCIGRAFDLVDITGDGRLSKAEISRVVRAAGFFIGYGMVVKNSESVFVPVGKLYLAQVVAAALGPFVAANLIDSYDYGGDGFVSLAELMQDRSFEYDLQGALAGGASGMAPETFDDVMKSVTGILWLLK